MSAWPSVGYSTLMYLDLSERRGSNGRRRGRRLDGLRFNAIILKIASHQTVVIGRRTAEKRCNLRDVYIDQRLGNRACLLCGGNALAGGIDQLLNRAEDFK